MTTRTTWLECSECNKMFEVSSAVAEAMHSWREESSDPFLCVECATHIAWGDAIVAMDGEPNSSRHAPRAVKEKYGHPTTNR